MSLLLVVVPSMPPSTGNTSRSLTSSHGRRQLNLNCTPTSLVLGGRPGTPQLAMTPVSSAIVSTDSFSRHANTDNLYRSSSSPSRTSPSPIHSHPSHHKLTPNSVLTQGRYYPSDTYNSNYSTRTGTPPPYTTTIRNTTPLYSTARK